MGWCWKDDGNSDEARRGDGFDRNKDEGCLGDELLDALGLALAGGALGVRFRL